MLSENKAGFFSSSHLILPCLFVRFVGGFFFNFTFSRVYYVSDNILNPRIMYIYEIRGNTMKPGQGSENITESIDWRKEHASILQEKERVEIKQTLS